jgi:cystathionine beta-lyase
MTYDFDSQIDRRGTCSVKYDFAAQGMPDDVLPLWVADMDFRTPPCVTEALAEAVRHGIFGYSMPDSGFFTAVQGWYSRRFNWNTEREWIIITPGVVTAIYIAIRALTGPNDGVVIQQPVYYPFESAIRQTGRQLLVNELVYDGGRYSIDFDDFEHKIKHAKLFILCSPHNPVGRVWTQDELSRMGDICLRNSVVVVSDEIHQDFVFPGHRHHVLAGLDPRLAEITITCTAPSKTFNLAGIHHSNIFISNEKIRGMFAKEAAMCGLNLAGLMGIVSCRAAYEGGEAWLLELLDYIGGNMSLTRDYLQSQVPRIKLVEPEGTYLAWLDFRGLGLPVEEIEKMLVHKARLWLINGAIFGQGGTGFFRVNTACPRSVLREGLDRLTSVFG